MNSLEKQIERVVQIPENEQNRLIRKMGKFDISSKIKVMEKHVPLFHQLRVQYSYIEDKSVLTYCAFILSLKENEPDSNSINYRSMKLRSIKNKNNIKRQKVLSYWAIVKKLHINENMSFRNIAIYLKKYNKLEVSHSLIFKIWHELEQEKEPDEY